MKYLDFANHVQSNTTSETLMTLIDLSPSMDYDDWQPTRKAGAITANQELIRNKLKYHPDDRMGIIGFDDNAQLLHAPVCIREGLQDLHRTLINPCGLSGTNFTAALELAEDCLFGNSTRPESNFFSKILSEIFIEPEKHNSTACKDDGSLKRIIMLTDGDHNGRVSPLDIASNLKNAGVIIDCIGIGGSPADVDEEILKQIASRNPDGSIRYCFIGDQQTLLKKYETLAHHIRAI